jgi:hypothetical protein
LPLTDRRKIPNKIWLVIRKVAAVPRLTVNSRTKGAV